MAAKTGARSQEFSQRLCSTLLYACTELCVIVLLHVAAAASYAAARLARIGRIRAPCTLCSRLDHALHGKPWFSSDLVCAAHRSEVSSLAVCRSHGNLALPDDLCGRCIHAFGGGDEVNSRTGSRSRRPCSCCSEPFKKAQKLSEAGNLVDSSHGSEEINRRSKVTARGNVSIAMPAKSLREHGTADHPIEKTSVVGREEVSELDCSPGRHEQPTRDRNGVSANAGAAKPVSALPSRSFVDRNSSIKNTIISRVNLPSPRPSEIISAMDNNSTTQQEVKALLTQMSSVRGLDCSWSEGSTSPGINVQVDDSNPIARRPSLERNYSILEPSYMNLAAGESEGEISIESLKQQVELNRRSMSALYKELDEERSASSIAASQAMAMINKLHEEKAAMQMEALQYLRMMEEQADHDHEAIQNLHDLLTEREKELLDMDSELENCQRMLQSEQQFNSKKLDSTCTSGYDMNMPFDVFNGPDFVGNTMSSFEDEKAYILESLSRLEEKIHDSEKLHNSINLLASDDAKNGDHAMDESTSLQRSVEEDHKDKEMLSGDHTVDESTFQMQQSVEMLSGDHTMDESTSLQQSVEEDNKDKFPCSTFDDDKMSAVTSLKDELSLLNTRMKALEDDQEFLKRVLNSLKCSTDGFQCVQEITVHLQELRRVVAQ